MRFVHLGDCHIGDNINFDRALSNKIRTNKKLSFESILKANKDVDFLLIAGDLYERSYFTISDYKELFKSFEDFGKDIFYVSGNHDYKSQSDERILELKPDNLHLFSTDNLEYYEMGSTRIYGISYKDRIFTQNFPYNLNLDSNYFNILLVHATINAPRSNYLNLELERLKNIGFDYVALGHIHKWEDFGENIYYSGSIEPSDFSDIYEYGYILYEDEKVSHKDTSIMKFHDISLSIDDFENENNLISYLKNQLDDSKENYMRLRIDQKINSKKIEDELNLEHLEIKIMENKSILDLKALYPNSLLTKYIEKFPDELDQTNKLALELGLDSIYRSKDD